MSKDLKHIRITNKNHPHFGEEGVVVKEDEKLSLSFLGQMDLIKNEDDEFFFAERSDYKIVNN